MVPGSARELAEQQRLQTTPASRSRSRADSSPDVEQFQICRRCDKIYAERMNHRNACSWHRGVRRLCIYYLPTEMWGTLINVQRRTLINQALQHLTATIMSCHMRNFEG